MANGHSTRTAGRLAFFATLVVIGAAGILHWGKPGIESAAFTAPVLAAATPCTHDAHSQLYHQHDGEAMHHHEHAAVDPIAIPARGRAHEVCLGGDAVKSFFILDEVVIGPAVSERDRDFEKLLVDLGLSIVRREPELGALVARHSGTRRIEAVVEQLERAPQIAWAEPNYVATVSQCNHSPFFTGADPVGKINAKVFESLGVAQAWELTRGREEIVIAVLDSGVDPAHEDLAGVLLPGKDFVNGDQDANDDAGHGTGIAGLIGARADGKTGIDGLAPGCRILPVKVADRGGKASFADLASGIVWAVNRGARVLNISLGSRTGSQVLAKAVRWALDQGAVVVAAAGNDNTNQVHYPAAYAGVIAVGALSPDGTVSSVTNLSPRIDVAAPGEKMISTLPTNFYRPVSGTSTSAALVSASAGLLLSLNPELTPAQVRQALRASAAPIECLAPVADLFGFGRLDLPRLLARRSGSLRDLAIAAVRALPEQPRTGEVVHVEIDVVNAGAVATAAPAPKLAGANGIQTRFPSFEEETLQPGERRTYVYTLLASAPVRLVASVEDGAEDEEAARNNQSTLVITPVDRDLAALKLVDMGMTEPAARAEEIRFRYSVRNTGNVPLRGVRLQGTLDGSDLPGAAAPIDLAVGETASADFAWTVPTPAPSGTRFFRARYASADGGAPVERPWTFILGNNHDGKELDPLYQQSGDVDIIADAPHRIAAGRSYLPLLVFVPSRGTAAAGPVLVLDRVTVTAKDDPAYTSPGTVVYDDSAMLGGVIEPEIAAAGLVQVDEDGAEVLRPDGSKNLNLFKDAAQTMNGRHAILRIPRAALGIAAMPSAPVKKYFQVDIHWKFYTLAGAAIPVKTGLQRWTLMSEFGVGKLPSLPGANHYYDTHNHTIAEWYQAVEVEPFAPMQAYGGPIQMIRESAYAIGLIDDPSDTHGKVVTTDHNAFYKNPLETDVNGPLHRPPFGPTSPAKSVGADGTIKSEFARMRELFGPACGEEIAFSQDIYFSGYPIPIGAHMLGYRGAQVPGTWHGGSMVSLALGEGAPLYLDTILKSMTKAHPDNTGAFSFAAHPYSMQGWFGDSMDKSIGVKPIYRNYDYVSEGSPNFVFRGLQIYNGYDAGSVPGEAIDFKAMNPWVHEGWTGGPGWDRELQIGLRNWHEMMSKTMSWAFYDKLGKKFIRKLYVSAGSDAHGNFNFSSSRLATLIPMPATFGMTRSSFGSCRSYVFTEGKAGATFGEKAMQALADGNHVATDGPVVNFSMDAEGRYDSVKQMWHDKSSARENADGKMGGGGAYGGEGTMLVKRGSPEMHFGWRWANNADFGSAGGALSSVLVYRTSDGDANPTQDRPYGTSFEKVVKGRGSLATGTADADLSEKVNGTEEGLVSKVSCYSLAAFTGSNPDVTPIAGSEHRCYTNPVWAIPYDVETTVTAVNSSLKQIDAGKLIVKFTFDLSMMPTAYKIGVKKLGAGGTTSDKSAAPITLCSPLGVWGTNFVTGADFAVLTVKNDAPIALSGDEYPTAGKYAFMVYFMDPPKDVNGNVLHSIATTFTVDKPVAAKKCFVEATRTGSALPTLPTGALALVLLLAAFVGRRRVA